MDDGGNGPSTGAGLRGRDLLGLGGFLVGAVVGGTVIGLLLDNAAGTAPLFVLIGVAVGILAGAVGFWAKVRTALRD
jgi:F0F1-type ATP synthase assembly protein I